MFNPLTVVSYLLTQKLFAKKSIPETKVEIRTQEELFASLRQNH